MNPVPEQTTYKKSKLKVSKIEPTTLSWLEVRHADHSSYEAVLNSNLKLNNQCPNICAYFNRNMSFCQIRGSNTSCKIR